MLFDTKLFLFLGIFQKNKEKIPLVEESNPPFRIWTPFPEIMDPASLLLLMRRDIIFIVVVSIY